LAQWCSENWTRYHVRFPDAATSVADYASDESAVIVYPTPTQSSVRVSTSAPSAIRIVDMYGRTMFAADESGSTANMEIDAASWTAGTYFVLSRNGTGRIVVTR